MSKPIFGYVRSSFGGWFFDDEMQQAASLTFAGDLIEKAQVAFAKFLTQEHDRRAAQFGQFVYSKGIVSFYPFSAWHSSRCAQLGGICDNTLLRRTRAS